MNTNYNLDLEMREYIEAFAFANIPNCIVLKANTTILIDHFMTIQTEGLQHGDIQERFFKNLDFYDGKLPHLLRKNNAKHDDFEVRQKLQNLSACYVCALVAKRYGISLKGLKTKLDKIEAASRKLKELLKFDILEFDLDLALIGGSLIVSDFVNTAKTTPSASTHEKMIDNLLFNRGTRLFRELDFFSNIRTEFSNSILGKWIQFGESGPKESSAINVWITGLAEIWLFDLNRSLTYSVDPSSGREQFLCFAENCFDYVHPTLIAESPDSLRNAYEKLRQKGKFDYPDENLGRLA